MGQTLTQLQKEMHEFHISMVDIQERVSFLEKQAFAAKSEKHVKVINVVWFGYWAHVFPLWRWMCFYFVLCISLILTSHQNSSHDIFNSYFKSDDDNSQGQDLTVPPVSHHGGSDLSRLSQQQQQQLDHSLPLSGERETTPISSADFHQANSLPQDMRINSASSSSREEQPQEQQMTGYITGFTSRGSVKCNLATKRNMETQNWTILFFPFSLGSDGTQHPQVPCHLDGVMTDNSNPMEFFGQSDA